MDPGGGGLPSAGKGCTWYLTRIRECCERGEKERWVTQLVKHRGVQALKERGKVHFLLGEKGDPRLKGCYSQVKVKRRKGKKSEERKSGSKREKGCLIRPISLERKKGPPSKPLEKGKARRGRALSNKERKGKRTV